MPRGPGIYTIWRGNQFLYVGIARRGGAGEASKGLFGRLDSHASGRRSGDQFCVYVCDRLVLPTLEGKLKEVGDGTLSLDALTRNLIRQELAFRVMPTAGYAEAQRLESEIKRRGLAHVGRPLLNPATLPD